MASDSLKRIESDQLAELLKSSQESALLDVRETGDATVGGVILLAVNLPLSNLELQVKSLVPRSATPIVVTDGTGEEEGLAIRAARRLTALGYSDVAVLDGGTAAWKASGRSLYPATGIIGQAFGEFIEETSPTPWIDAEDLRERLRRGDNLVMLDSRPVEEFLDHSIPGAVDCPGGGGVRRAFDYVTDPEALVVVNCAGRTRSILGAQALINAGLPNPVVSLKGGTLAWLLAGEEVAAGRSDHVPEPTPEGEGKGLAGIQAHADRIGLQQITHEELKGFQADDSRTLYILDVRSPAAFAEGHLPGSKSAPSWEIHSFNRHVATRHARIVVVDGPKPILGLVAASWILQLGWRDVFVLPNAFEGVELEEGTYKAARFDPPADAPVVDAAELKRLLDAGEATVVDLQISSAGTRVGNPTGYLFGHIPGAAWAIRSQLPDVVDRVEGSSPIVLTSSDGTIAKFAVDDIAGLTGRSVLALEGGTDAWVAAGFELETGATKLLSEPTDVQRGHWDKEGEERLEGFRTFLEWEENLQRELEHDELNLYHRYDELVG